MTCAGKKSIVWKDLKKIDFHSGERFKEKGES